MYVYVSLYGGFFMCEALGFSPAPVKQHAGVCDDQQYSGISLVLTPLAKQKVS